jgi:RNA polymerase sigma-70 factor (ECF subfamily)
MLQVREGDGAAFDALVAEYYHHVLAVIQHLMGSSQQAEDLAQEVFLRVYRARSSYQPDSKFSTWLFVIVNNVVRNARRTLARRREVSVPRDNTAWCQPLDLRAYGETPDTALLRQETRQTIREAIETLNPRQRRAMMLYHYQGMSYAKIAAQMDTTLLAAKALLHRARVALRDNLESFVNA